MFETCSKLTINFKANNWDLTHCSDVSVADFEQVNIDWDSYLVMRLVTCYQEKNYQINLLNAMLNMFKVVINPLVPDVY